MPVIPIIISEYKNCMTCVNVIRDKNYNIIGCRNGINNECNYISRDNIINEKGK